MPNEEEASTREGNGADVAAGVIVGVGPAPGLILRAVERHTPDGQVNAVLLRAVEAIQDVCTVRGDVWIEGPVVVLDVFRIVLGHALQDVTVEIQQVEVARIAGSQHGNQLGMVGRDGWLRPIARRSDLDEIARVQLEEPSLLNYEHRPRELELWLRRGGLLGPLLDDLAF